MLHKENFRNITMGKVTYKFYTFLSFASVFLYIDPFYTGLGRSIQACFALAMFSFICLYRRSYLKVQTFRMINIFAYMLILSILITSFLNKDLSLGGYPISSYTLGILYAIILLNTLFFVEFSIVNRKQNLMFRYYFNFLFVLCIIVDFLIFTIGSPVHAFYYVGDKFTISYLHIFLIALYCVNNGLGKRKVDLKLICLISISFLVCRRVSCSTGQIGVILLSILFLYNNAKKIIPNAYSMLLYVAIFSFISFVFTQLLEIPFIHDFVVNDLGKDETMTGRTEIYLVLWQAVQINPWFGWGQGNGMSFMGYYFSTPNAQNGFFNYVTDYGFVGVAALLLFLFYVCRITNVEKAYPLWALIFVFIALSSVEITFNLQFIVYIILLLPFVSLPKPKEN